MLLERGQLPGAEALVCFGVEQGADLRELHLHDGCIIAEFGKCCAVLEDPHANSAPRLVHGCQRSVVRTERQVRNLGIVGGSRQFGSGCRITDLDDVVCKRYGREPAIRAQREFVFLDPMTVRQLPVVGIINPGGLVTARDQRVRSPLQPVARLGMFPLAHLLIVAKIADPNPVLALPSIALDGGDPASFRTERECEDEIGEIERPLGSAGHAPESDLRAVAGSQMFSVAGQRDVIPPPRYLNLQPAAAVGNRPNRDFRGVGLLGRVVDGGRC